MIIHRYHRSLFKFLMFFGLPYSATMTTKSNHNNYQLLEKVVGYENRKNDILLFSNSIQSSSNTIVYYFGGDIQDLPERMNSSKENRKYQRWNLVSTGEILCRRFLDSSIAIIRPNEMIDGTFSRFSNFVPKTTDYGDPISYDTNNLIGLHHLRALDEQIMKQTTSLSDIIIVGFSKGCVVLNQLLHELAALRSMKADVDLSKFVLRIRTFIWLDGGHNNGNRIMIWPTDENLVSTLVYYKIKTEIYVTPFQINSQNPYKQYHTQQYKKFSELLLVQSTNSTENDHKIINKMFFADEPPSIDKHFELLTVF
ncbi:unnamed protein product [Rotaria sp. Silwood1]|nr:unnamed protein product [Rotaria sp. Silwood1]CAF1060546.1 unnamed protein product [Rotaria sp. Silwood1]CAF4765116.1 unnamed protein product [Rotaria sp. Silwood1]